MLGVGVFQHCDLIPRTPVKSSTPRRKGSATREGKPVNLETESDVAGGVEDSGSPEASGRGSETREGTSAICGSDLCDRSQKRSESGINGEEKKRSGDLAEGEGGGESFSDDDLHENLSQSDRCQYLPSDHSHSNETDLGLEESQPRPMISKCLFPSENSDLSALQTSRMSRGKRSERERENWDGLWDASSIKKIGALAVGNESINENL